MIAATRQLTDVEGAVRTPVEARRHGVGRRRVGEEGHDLDVPVGRHVVEGVRGRIDHPLVVLAGEDAIRIAVRELPRNQVLVAQAPVPVELPDTGGGLGLPIAFHLDDLSKLGFQRSQGVVVGYELESEAYCIRSPPQGDEGQAPGKGLDDEEQQRMAASPVSLLVGQHDPAPPRRHRPHEALGDDGPRKEQPGREREAVG